MSSFPIGGGRYRIQIETEPFNGLQSCRVDGHVLHPGNEVQDIAALLAVAETVPDVFTDTDPELCRVRAFVNRTRPTQAVSASFELVKQTVMLEQLIHGDGRFDGLEVHK